MKLYVIRHGETEMGKNEIIATEDEPLNEFGIQQAKKNWRKFEKIRHRCNLLLSNRTSKTYIRAIWFR